MSENRLRSLVKAIERYRKKAIIAYFRLYRKERLEKLYHLLLLHDEEEKEIIFRKLFRKAYTLKNDYLYRNELRHLKKFLFQFLVKDEMEWTMHEHPSIERKFLLQALGRLDLHDYFLHYYQSAIDTSIHSGDYWSALEVNLLKGNLIGYIVPNMKERPNAFADVVSERGMLLQHLISLVVAQQNFMIGNINYFAHGFNDSSHVTDEITAFEWMKSENPLSNFYGLLGKQVQSHGSEQLHFLQEALNQISLLDERNAFIYGQKLHVIYLLARENSSQGNWEEANRHFAFLFQLEHIDHYPFSPGLFGNYTTNLIKLKEFHTCLKVIELVKDKFPLNAIYQILLLQNRLISYIFLNETKLFRKHYPKNIDELTWQSKYAFLILSSIHFYQEENFEMALHEIHSLKTWQGLKDQFIRFKPIVDLLEKFYTGCYRSGSHHIDMEYKKPILKEIEIIEQGDAEIKTMAIYEWCKLALTESGIL